jgi:hypothetical protein
METSNRVYLFVIILLIVIIITSAVILANINQPLTSAQLEECKTLQYKGEGKIGIVFFASKDIAEQYYKYFLDTNPFKNYKEDFNFFYIAYKPECELYKEIAILCDSKEIKRKAAACPHDFIAVIKEEPKEIRSSSYVNIMSINSAHPKTVYIHEFGHAFANLAEEYNANQNPPRSSKNCKKSCVDFGEEKDGCFPDCSSSTYFRSIENGVMRTLYPENPDNQYGIFNSNLAISVIQETISEKSSTITGRQVSTAGEEFKCENQEFLAVEVNLEKKEISEITRNPGCPAENGAGDYSYSLYDKENKIILTENFNPYIFTEAQKENELIIQG